MFLFHILVLPAILIVPCYLKKSYRAFVMPAIFGVILAILWALFDNFFVFTVKYFEFSLAKIFLAVLIKNTLVPLLLTSTVYFILVKGSWEQRAKDLFPLWTSFFSIALPYTVKSGQVNFSFFELFISPLIFACLLIQLNSFINAIFNQVLQLKALLSSSPKEKSEKNKLVLNISVFSLLILSVLAVFSLIHTLWFAGEPWIFWLILFALFVCFTVVVIFRTRRAEFFARA